MSTKSFLHRIRPSSLSGQLMLALLAALIAAQAIAFFILADERRLALESVKRDQVMGRTASIVRVLNETPPDMVDRVLRAANTRQLQFETSPQSALDVSLTEYTSNRFTLRLRRLLGHSDATRILVQVNKSRHWEAEDDDEDDHDDDDPWNREDDEHHWHGRQPTIVMALELSDGTWLNATYRVARPPRSWAYATLLIIGLTGLCICGAAFLMVRRITRPLAQLSKAAEALGRGDAGPALEPGGPDEIRRTTSAFNQMQDRLERFVSDRTRMLAAISHDLRTPLTAMRLRVEMLEDDALKRKILASLEDMQRMTEATLSFARDDALKEETRTADLSSMIESIASDFTDLGEQVTLNATTISPFRCRPVALKRALRNLVENAVRYGGQAAVMLREDDSDGGNGNDGGVEIVIEDQGPGIPPEYLETVFDPFYRVEASRSPESGGIGLGLSIARTVVQAHGGTIVLENCHPSGLRVSVHLPAFSAE